MATARNSNSNTNTNTNSSKRVTHGEPQGAPPEIIDTPQSPEIIDEELAKLRAELQAELEAAIAIDRPDGPCGPARAGQEQIRCKWTPAVQQAAATAAVRLPGTFPIRGDGPKLAERLGEAAGFGMRTKVPPVIPTRKGDVALQGVYRASARLANGESVSVILVLTLVEITRQKCRLKKATEPEWMDYLTPVDDGHGKATCLLYHLSRQSGRDILLTPSGMIRPV